tara:strand:+ start:2238 stop:2522 length:285 start_codon:yes stop_codon:yes gene_type:complete
MIHNLDRLQIIKENIEKMQDTYHLQVFNTLREDDKINFTENSNGVFINLTTLDEDNIVKLENYINYYNKQQNELVKQESTKNKIKKEFFIKDKR